ncbi:MAG: hypothetical protein ACYSUI_21775, partial [Planctomycetota bacterium]
MQHPADPRVIAGVVHTRSDAVRIEAQQLRQVIAHADKPEAPISPAYRRTAVFALLVNREQSNLLL